MEFLKFNLDPYTFTGSAVVIGLILVNELSALEQNSIGNWLQLVGLTVQTYASQEALIESYNTDETSDTSDIEKIKKAIEKINSELDKIKNNRSNNEI